MSPFRALDEQGECACIPCAAVLVNMTPDVSNRGVCYLLCHGFRGVSCIGVHYPAQRVSEEDNVDQSGMLDVNGARLYYEMRGEGHPVVLAHAGIADSRMWDDQMEAFARRYTVVRYDHRGFGKSTIPPAPYSPHEDLRALLHALGIERAHLVGVSMSGAMVVDFALAHPEMVTALVPVCPGLGGYDYEEPEQEKAAFQQIEEAVKAGDFARANDLEVHIWVDGLGRTPEQVNPAVRERVREMNAPGFARQAEYAAAKRQELDPPAATRLHEIHAPTLAIIGDQDLLTVQMTVDKLATEIPGARKAVIHGAAHVPNMERPEEFNQLVLDFLGAL